MIKNKNFNNYLFYNDNIENCNLINVNNATFIKKIKLKFSFNELFVSSKIKEKSVENVKIKSIYIYYIYTSLLPKIISNNKVSLKDNLNKSGEDYSFVLTISNNNLIFKEIIKKIEDIENLSKKNIFKLLINSKLFFETNQFFVDIIEDINLEEVNLKFNLNINKNNSYLKNTKSSKTLLLF